MSDEVTGFDSVESRGLYNPNNDEHLKYVLNTDDVIVRMEEYLRGIRFDRERGSYIQISRKKVSEECISDIISLLFSGNSRGFILSEYDPEEIFRILSTKQNILVKRFIENSKEYSSGDVPLTAGEIRFIVNEVIDILGAALKRAKYGMGIKVLRDTFKTSEVSTAGGQGGGMGNLIPFK